jgi:N-acetylglucosamine-6-phosphate deacetylase
MDVHLHGIGDYDTRTDSPEDLLSIADMEGREGIGAILLSIYPAPLSVMRRHVAAVRGAMERQLSAITTEQSGGHSTSNQHQIPHHFASARILGAHLEGPFLNPLRCGALDPRVFLAPSWHVYRQLVEGFEDTIRSITIAPELEGAPELIKQIAGSGVVVSMGHSDATFNEAENGFHAGATGVTHVFNAMRPFHHREPGISGFALTNPHVYLEVIGDPHHLHLETMRLIFGVKPSNRVLLISDSVKGTRAGTGPIQDQPGGPSEPLPAATDAGRLRGGSMSIAASLARLIAAGMDEGALLQAITDNPYRYLSGR